MKKSIAFSFLLLVACSSAKFKIRPPKIDEVLVSYFQEDQLKTDMAKRLILDTVRRDTSDPTTNKLVTDTFYFVPQLDTLKRDSAGTVKYQTDSLGHLKLVINFYSIDKQFILKDYNFKFSRRPPGRFVAR